LSTLIKGLVESVKSNEGKFGPMYSIYVNGTGYGTGKNSQGASAGDFVEFAAVQNERGYWNVEKGTLKPTSAPAGVSAPAAAPTNRPAATTNPVGDARQDSIVFQSSRKDALEFVKLLQAAGKIDFGKSKGADSIAILETYVDKFTEHFVSEAAQRKTFPAQSAKTDTAAGDSAEDPNDALPF
jgi:hypothetical protein